MQKAAKFSAISQKDLAVLHGVGQRSIHNWDGDGHADAARNSDGSYDATKSIGWRITRDSHAGWDVDAERARLARAQAEKAELDLQVRRGTLLERADVVRDGQALVSAMRARMRALPSRLTPEIAGPDTYAAVRAKISAGIDEALLEISDEKFANTVVTAALDRRGGEDSSATPAANGKPVGRPAPRTVERGQQRARKVVHRKG